MNEMEGYALQGTMHGAPGSSCQLASSKGCAVHLMARLGVPAGCLAGCKRTTAHMALLAASGGTATTSAAHQSPPNGPPQTTPHTSCNSWAYLGAICACVVKCQPQQHWSLLFGDKFRQHGAQGRLRLRRQRIFGGRCPRRGPGEGGVGGARSGRQGQCGQRGQAVTQAREERSQRRREEESWVGASWRGSSRCAAAACEAAGCCCCGEEALQPNEPRAAMGRPEGRPQPRQVAPCRQLRAVTCLMSGASSPGAASAVHPARSRRSTRVALNDRWWCQQQPHATELLSFNQPVKRGMYSAPEVRGQRQRGHAEFTRVLISASLHTVWSSPSLVDDSVPAT